MKNEDYVFWDRRLPKTSTSMILFHLSNPPPEVSTSQRYRPLSAEVTFNTINVSLLGTQVTLKRPTKADSIDGVPAEGIWVATASPSNSIMIATIVKSAVKLKLKLSSLLTDPCVKLWNDVKVTMSFVTVSNGGGSYQVILPPSETKTSRMIIKTFFQS